MGTPCARWGSIPLGWLCSRCKGHKLFNPPNYFILQFGNQLFIVCMKYTIPQYIYIAQLNFQMRGLPGGLVVQIPCSQCRSPGLIPAQWTRSYMLQLRVHVTQKGPSRDKFKKKKNFFFFQMKRCQLKLHHRNQSVLYLIFSKKRPKSSGKQLNNRNAILKKNSEVLRICCCCVASVVSDSVRPHRQQPTRLPHPWDSPGKNTGVGCHFLLQGVSEKWKWSCSVVSNS